MRRLLRLMLAVFLAGAAICDARKERVPVWLLLLVSVPACLLFVMKTPSIRLLALASVCVFCIPAAVAAALSRIGAADVWILLLLVLALDLSDLAGCLAHSALMSAAAAACCFFLRPQGKDPQSAHFPGIPYLLLGCLAHFSGRIFH